MVIVYELFHHLPIIVCKYTCKFFFACVLHQHTSDEKMVNTTPGHLPQNCFTSQEALKKAWLSPRGATSTFLFSHDLAKQRPESLTVAKDRIQPGHEAKTEDLMSPNCCVNNNDLEGLDSSSPCVSLDNSFDFTTSLVRSALEDPSPFPVNCRDKLYGQISVTIIN